MPKLDLKVFETLGGMIKPPPPPKPHKEEDDWMPDLNPAQAKLFFSEAKYILCWAEKFSGKTIACLHKVMKHCFENRNALAILLTKTGNMSKDGGSWHKLMTDVLPQWEEGLGIKWKLGMDKQHNTFVWVQNQYDEWSMIMDTSAPHPEQLRERFRGREPSIVFVDELTSCGSDEYFKAIAAQLGRRPMVEGAQQYIAATNPDDPEHWVHQMWFGDGEKEPGPDFVNFYFPASENFRNVGEEYFKGLAEVYRNDDAGSAWMIRGEWIPRPSGDGLFRDIYQTALHVQPLNEDGKPDFMRRLVCNPEYPMIIGLDPGSVYNAFVFQQWLPIELRQRWMIFDEIITIKKRVSYEHFIPAVMRRMRWWMDEAGRDMPFVWISDSSAFNQYRAAQGSFDVLEIERIYEAHRAKFKLAPLKIKAAPKFNGSVVARTRLGQKMLADRDIIVSAGCTFVQKMFMMLEAKKPKFGEPIDPEAMLTPQRSDYIHCWDAVSYPWLAASLSPTAVQPTLKGDQSLISAAA